MEGPPPGRGTPSAGKGGGGPAAAPRGTAGPGEASAEAPRGPAAAAAARPEAPGGEDDVEFIRIEEAAKCVRARDVHGQGLRAKDWKGGNTFFLGSHTPVDVVRREQRTWAEQHPEQLLKWSFPTKRGDSFRVHFRAIERMEGLVSSEFLSAFVDLTNVSQGFPPSAARVICFVYMNYLQPYHKQIFAQGRHLLMVKVYEDKNEANFWHIPIKEVRDLHKQSSEVMKGGVSLNDVQLVETYEAASTFAVHCETFSCIGAGHIGQRGNMYGQCTWVGGMALHLIPDDAEDPAYDRSLAFAAMPDEELAELTEKRAKLREKRARKKANQAAKKAEAADVQAAQEKALREQMEAACVARRKEGLLQPHESLREMFKSSKEGQ